MDVKLHANATTTPRTRRLIQQSRASNAALARELGVHPCTVARWRKRDHVQDRSHVPHRLATTMTDMEEALTVELRTALALPLDDIVEVMRRCHRRFVDHAERDAYLNAFVADYNRTRLRCLDYKAPAEILRQSLGTKHGGRGVLIQRGRLAHPP